MAKITPRELQKVMIKNKMCLTFPLSSSSVSMTIVNVLCSQIIRQKSSIVSSRGPVEKRKKVMKRGFFFSFLHLHCFSTEPFKRILHQSRDHTKIFNLPCVAIYAFSLRYPCKTITGIQVWKGFSFTAHVQTTSSWFLYDLDCDNTSFHF